jgi:probable HAF family extracellular repeat protein
MLGGYLNAFLWTGSSLTNLGTLGGTASSGYGVNDAGWVVGSSLTTGNTTTDGFLYSNGTMTDLNSLLPIGSGWTITDATAINDAGDILAIGQADGQDWAVELTPGQSAISSAAVPEPGAVALVALGLIILSRVGRKRVRKAE